MIDLNPKYLETIQRILAEHVPKCEVHAFGSRVKWTAKDYSDLDLVVVGSEPLTLRKLRQLKEAFEESNLPIRVDVVDWQSLADWFKKVIAAEHGVIQKAEPIKESKQSEGVYGKRDMMFDFPDGWQLRSIENSMKAIIDYRGKTSRKTLFGIPLITAKIVKGGRIMTPDEFIALEDYDSWMRRGLPEPGDVVMTMEAPLGEVAQLDVRKIALAQRLITLRGKPNLINNTYLKFAMQSAFVQNQLKARSTGTTVLGIRQSELKKVEIPIPPLDEQNRIAHILGTLDDKIELNRQMNETLEAMARAIFKSWFVDFDPVRAKMEGRMPASMDAATATLFPSAFQDSPVGKIPEGWEVVSLPEVIEVNPRRVLKKGTTAPYLHMQNLPTQGHRPDNWTRREFNSGTKFINGDTLLARITPCIENGKTGFVDFLAEGEVGWGSTEYIVFRPKPPLPVEFGYYLARSNDLRTFAIHNMTGTTGRQRVPASCFDYYQFPVPTTPIAQQFSEIVQPFMEKIRVNSEQSRTLSQIRETLLPKLLSGEIRVTNVDKRLEVKDGGTS